MKRMKRVLKFKTTETRKKYKFIILSFKKVELEDLVYKELSPQNFRGLDVGNKK